MKELTEEELISKHIATHPLRYKITRILLGTKGSFIYELAEKLTVDKK